MSSAPPTLRPAGPIDVADRFAPLHARLMELLESLAPEDWNRPTACALWSVRDIVAHLLDVSLRRLSFQRDGMALRPDSPIRPGDELVAWLDRLNAEWVAAARRLSPRVLIELHRYAGPRLAELFRSLDPDAPAPFAVAWAGETASANWFDVGREYTEHWLHQAQIRDAVAAPALAGREWLHPVLDLFLRALPHAYRDVPAGAGTSLEIAIDGEAGGTWSLRREDDGWRLYRGGSEDPAARLALSPDTAWRIFSRGIAPEAAHARVAVAGDAGLAAPFFRSLAIMAPPA